MMCTRRLIRSGPNAWAAAAASEFLLEIWESQRRPLTNFCDMRFELIILQGSSCGRFQDVPCSWIQVPFSERFQRTNRPTHLRPSPSIQRPTNTRLLNWFGFTGAPRVDLSTRIRFLLLFTKLTFLAALQT